MKSLSVLLVEDWVLIRRSLAAMLAREMDAKVASCSSSGLVEGTAAVAGRVVLIDAVTWTAGFPALLKVVRKTSPVAPVVLLGRDDNLRDHAKAVAQGALALVRITTDARGVFKSVRAAAKRQMWFEEGLLMKVVTELTGAKERREKAGLDARDEEVLELVANGKRNKEIAEMLGCSERAVKGRVTTLLQKIGARNRSGLTRYAVTNELARIRL
jgi:DNA-binding NarL/FixJ family response regulator